MSSVENLNKVFLELCDDLENVVSGFEEYIENSRKRIQENPSTKYYLEYYFRHCLPYADKITNCDESGLLDMNVLHGVKFGDVYKRNFPISSKHAIWRYLHTFYLLVQSYPKLDRIIEKYKDNENIDRIRNSLGNHDTNLRNIMNSSTKFAEEIIKEQVKPTEDGKMPDMSSFLNGMDENKFESEFLNSKIGNLAKEISEELNGDDLKCMENPDDLMKNLLSGEGGGLGNIIQKVSTKLQNKMQNGELNEDALMKEATNMMSMLNPAFSKMAGGGMGGMGGMGNLFSMMGGMMGGGGNKKKSKKPHKN
jgi:flavodoxin